jgi:hypothetical protein
MVTCAVAIPLLGAILAGQHSLKLSPDYVLLAEDIVRYICGAMGSLKLLFCMPSAGRFPDR